MLFAFCFLQLFAEEGFQSSQKLVPRDILFLDCGWFGSKVDRDIVTLACCLLCLPNLLCRDHLGGVPWARPLLMVPFVGPAVLQIPAPSLCSTFSKPHVIAQSTPGNILSRKPLGKPSSSQAMTWWYARQQTASEGDADAEPEAKETLERSCWAYFWICGSPC